MGKNYTSNRQPGYRLINQTSTSNPPPAIKNQTYMPTNQTYMPNPQPGYVTEGATGHLPNNPPPGMTQGFYWQGRIYIPLPGGTGIDSGSGLPGISMPKETEIVISQGRLYRPIPEGMHIVAWRVNPGPEPFSRARHPELELRDLSVERCDSIKQWLDSVHSSDITLGHMELMSMWSQRFYVVEEVAPSFVMENGQGLYEQYIHPKCPCGELITEFHQVEQCKIKDIW